MVKALALDPYLGIKYRVIGEGISGGFQEVEGLEGETDSVEYREGEDEPTPRQQPGLTKYSNVVLKRGISNDRSLQEWRETVAKPRTIGVPAGYRKDLTIELLDESGLTVVKRWRVYAAWPQKLSFGKLAAQESSVMIEELTLVNEGHVQEL